MPTVTIREGVVTDKNGVTTVASSQIIDVGESLAFPAACDRARIANATKRVDILIVNGDKCVTMTFE